jgi:ribonuclease E
MANKMLIDAAHPEETRVVVLRGNRVEEFDFESAHRRQLRGNIYLAKVTRVEPSLQAAFVDYGGNRHGFLAFSEIHPDYYQIPVADRQALIDEDQRAQRAADEEIDRRSRRRHRGRQRPLESRHRDEAVRGDVAVLPGDAAGTEQPTGAPESADAAGEAQLPDFSAAGGEEPTGNGEPQSPAAIDEPPPDEDAPDENDSGEPYPSAAEATVEAMSEPLSDSNSESVSASDTPVPASEPQTASPDMAPFAATAESGSEITSESEAEPSVAREADDDADGAENDTENGDIGDEVVESVGGADVLEEVPDRAPRYRRPYKIQ